MLLLYPWTQVFLKMFANQKDYISIQVSQKVESKGKLQIRKDAVEYIVTWKCHNKQEH